MPNPGPHPNLHPNLHYPNLYPGPDPDPRDPMEDLSKVRNLFLQVELFHVAKMLSFGGVLMLHDNWMPSVQKVQGFISANMPSLQNVTNPLGFQCCVTIYTKTKHDQRKWNHFRPF